MKRRIAWLVCLLFALCVPFSAGASVVQPNDWFYVYDGANAFSDATTETIVRNNDALYEACGAQIVFVAVPSTGSTDIGDYAYSLFESWGVGSGEKNNGVLILLEIGAEDYWYMQGSGIERSLSTADLAELVNEYLEPDFAVQDYDAGAIKLFEQLFERVADIYGAGVQYQEYDGSGLAQLSAGSSDTDIIEGVGQAYDNGGAVYHFTLTGGLLGWAIGGIFRFVLGVVLIVLCISLIGGLLRSLSYSVRGMTRPVGMGFWLFRPWRVFRPRRPRPPRNPMGGFGPGPGGPAGGAHRSGFGGSSGRNSGFSGGGRSSGLGGGRSGGGRAGGGGGSRGGGGGRGR